MVDNKEKIEVSENIEPDKEIRKRGWNGSRNYTYDNKHTPMTEDEWRNMIVEHYTNLGEAIKQKNNKDEYLFFIIHDKDIDKNGIPKSIHVHFVVRYKNGRTQSAVMADFCGSNARGQNCEPIDPRMGGYKSALRYLTHHTDSAYNEEKIWYHHSEVFEFNARYLDVIKSLNDKKRNTRDIKQSADELIASVIRGDITVETALGEFEDAHGALASVEYMSKFESGLRRFAKQKSEELKKRSKESEWLRLTTYISGPGQTGKSRMSVKMAEIDADAFGVHIVNGGGGKNITTDIVDGYGYEKASVLNDYDTNDFKYRAFYNMFDETNYTDVKSRNFNKPWFPERVYINSDLTLGEFLLEILYFSTKSFQKVGNVVDLESDRAFELNGRKKTLEACRMLGRRIRYYMQFGTLDDGTPVVYLMRRLKDLADIDEIKAYCGGKYDERIFDLFFERFAYIEYDPTYIDDKQFDAERGRIGKLAHSAFESSEKVDGVHYIDEPVILFELRKRMEAQEEKKIAKQMKEARRIMELEHKAKEYEKLKSISVKQIEAEQERYALIRMIMEKTNDSNPFGADQLFHEFERLLDEKKNNEQIPQT